MSNLPVAELAAALSADLGLPHALVRWTLPLHSALAPPPTLRHAIATLSHEAGGGLLVIHAARTGEERATRTLRSTLRGLPITETQAVPCTDGLAIACTVAAVRQPPALGDLAPVPDLDLSVLRSDAAQRLAPLVRPSDLAGMDDGLDPRERVLLAAGAATLLDGVLAPTVAGLVAFGFHPESYLGGSNAVVEGRRVVRIGGDPVSLHRAIVRELGLLDPAAEAVRSLVLHALVVRRWVPHRSDDPIRVLVVGRELEVRWPDSDTDRPNPTLRRLLRACRALTPLAEDPRALGAWLQARAGSRIELEGEGSERVATLRLPALRRLPPQVDVVEAVEVPEPLAPVAAPPDPEPPRLASDSRDAVLLALFVSQRELSAREVMAELRWSRSTTRDVLARLVAAGAIVCTASSPRSPHQTYLRRTDQVGPPG